MEALGYASAAVAVFLALCLAEARLVLRRSGPVAHLLMIWLGVAVAAAVFLLATGGPRALPVAMASLAIYLFAGEIVLFAYAAALTSLSIRILVDAVDGEPGPDALARALAHHPPGAFLDVRLESFVANGHMTLSDGRYRVTPRGRRWADAGRVLKRVLAVGHGG